MQRKSLVLRFCLVLVCGYYVFRLFLINLFIYLFFWALTWSRIAQQTRGKSGIHLQA